jgi:nascent polypeptide-associated complex subunit alpha
MFGLGGLNPKKMQAVMKQMGISQNEIPASKVTIEKTDGSKIVIPNPSVTKMTIQGQDMFQIQGESQEETPEVGFSEEDIQSIIEKTGANKEQAQKALEETGDLAEAIMSLSEQ